jgi:long-chain-fatty-acyl-CoA reductase
LSFMDVAPEHPVSRATSVIYWPRDDAVGKTIAEQVDGICVWGEVEALRWARENCRDDAEVVCFGPRRSMAFVGREADHRRAARGLAHDVCVYEQKACFSVREAFVEGPIEPFVHELHAAMEEYQELLPPARRTFDEMARAAFVRREEEFLDSAVMEAGDASWSIVVTEPSHAIEHPLGRTIYIYAVNDPSEMLAWVDRTVQTVAVQPWDRLQGLRDELAVRGVSRMVELGLNNLFRVGGSHDGMQPLARLVRMVSVERPAAVHGRGMVVVNDQTEFLKAGTLRTMVL